MSENKTILLSPQQNLDTKKSTQSLEGDLPSTTPRKNRGASRHARFITDPHLESRELYELRCKYGIND